MCRLLELRHPSQMWVIDAAMAKMNAELSIDLPKAGGRTGGVKVDLEQAGATPRRKPAVVIVFAAGVGVIAGP